MEEEEYLILCEKLLERVKRGEGCLLCSHGNYNCTTELWKTLFVFIPTNTEGEVSGGKQLAKLQKHNI